MILGTCPLGLARPGKRHIAEWRPIFCLLAALNLVGCTDEFTVVPLHDLEVFWTIEKSNDPRLCTEFGIAVWDVFAEGPDSQELVSRCRDQAWNSGFVNYQLKVGHYSVRITAVGFESQVLVEKELTIDLGSTETSPDRLEVDFQRADFE